MRFLDFSFNGHTIEPIVEFSSAEKAGAQVGINNIKSIGEAKRIALARDIAIKGMEKKEQEDAYAAISSLEQKQREQAAASEKMAQQVSHLKGEYFVNYGEHYTSYSPIAAEQT